VIMQSIKTSVVRWELLAALGIFAVGASLPAYADEKPKQDERNIQYRVGPDGKMVAVVVAPVPDSPAFARFDKWVADYLVAKDETKKKIEEEGIRLAVDRRQAMVELIKRDPKRALERAIYPEERQQLPARVVSLLEDFLQGRAHNNIVVMTIKEEVPVPDQPGTKRSVFRSINQGSFEFRGQSYTPHFYGKRKGMLSKRNLPFYGIALDGQIAIHENPLRVLTTNEIVSSLAKPGEKGTRCPVCDKEAKDGKIAILGNTLLYFDTQEHVQKFIEQLWEAEQVIGPDAHG